MMETIWTKLFSPFAAFDHPVTVWLTILAGSVLVATPIMIEVMSLIGKVDHALRGELYRRTFSWSVLIPLILGPVLLGPGCTMLAIMVLSLLCYREFARATGFFRHRSLSVIVVLGVLGLFLASFDHWYDFFVALTTLTIALIAIVALLKDEPKGYIQRIALGALSFLLFGVCFGQMAYMANDADYRPIILSIIFCVELNDIFAYIAGKSFGRRKLAPNTSPNKTLGGFLGALVLTTGLFAILGHFVFRSGPLDHPVHLVVMGLIVSLVGQLGDLVISSIKRDLGVKDMGTTLPGHGGLLDRFDSLIFVAPALFHYIGYFHGFGLDQPIRILSGG